MSKLEDYYYPSYSELHQKAEDVIESANISAIEHLMLLSLLDKAVNQDEACQFILDKVSQGSEANTRAEDILRGIKQGLLELAKRFCLRGDHVSADLQESLRRRQGNICHISGSDTDLKPVYMVSPSIVDDQELKQGDPW